jgi:serpin B
MKTPHAARTYLLILAALMLPKAATGSPPPPESTRTLLAGGNTFAFELYGKLARTSGNVFFSPASVHAAVAMVYTGARGATATGIAKAMHYPASVAALGASYRTLLADWGSGAEVGDEDANVLEVANALWASDALRFEPAFTGAIERDYGGVARSLDFGDASHAAVEINGWVARKTRERIRDLVPASGLNASTSLVLTNAIYFRGHWASPFQKRGTRDEAFHFATGDTARVPMMSQMGSFAYAEGPGVQVVSLPYADHRLSMVVLLPRRRDGLAELERGLRASTVNDWLAHASHQRVDLFLPRFTFSQAVELSRPLSELGMRAAFDRAVADFSGMTTQRRTFVTAVLHKAFIAADETGTEAAAATGVVMTLTAARPQPMKPPVVFRADHPFIFLIQDDRTGAILFLGRVADPRS